MLTSDIDGLSVDGEVDFLNLKNLRLEVTQVIDAQSDPNVLAFTLEGGEDFPASQGVFAVENHLGGNSVFILRIGLVGADTWLAKLGQE